MSDGESPGSVSHPVGSSSEIDWILQRNMTFLQDFLTGNSAPRARQCHGGSREKCESAA